MSTRAVIAYTLGDGRWQGVWNHWSSDTEYLGKAIVERVALLQGDLQKFRQDYIDACPQGWSNFANTEHGDNGGLWSGSIVPTLSGPALVFERGQYSDDSVTTQLPDANYLYLLDLPERRLSVVEVDEGECSSFTDCTFDEVGNASPTRLQHTDVETSSLEHSSTLTEAMLVAAATQVLGNRTFETAANSSDIDLYLVVHVATKPESINEVDLKKVRAQDIDADPGDELLFLLNYCGEYEQTAELVDLLDLPPNASRKLRAALLSQR